MRNYITPEANSKFFLRRANNIVNNQIVYNKNFVVYSSKNFKIIKNIVELELFFGQRPMIIASFLKKSLVINMKVTKNNRNIEYLPFLQKSPVMWKKYISGINLFDYYNIPPYLNSSRGAITAKFNKISKYQSWLKSAYLD